MEWESKFKDAWSATEVKSSGPRIPDGKNKIRIADAGYDPVLRAAKWKLEFPDAGGKFLTKSNFLFDKAGVPQFQWTKQDLEALGSPCESLDELDDALKSTIGKMAQVTLVTPPGSKYTNIYFNHQLPDGEMLGELGVPADW